MLEIIKPIDKGNLKFAIFDFDGTLSLIREGWQNIMIPMMVDILLATGKNESRDVLELEVKKFVTDLTGKQTIYQMIRLADEVKLRGGIPLEPIKYKNIYHDKLLKKIDFKINGLKDGSIKPKAYLVSGSFEILDLMKKHNIKCYLASGTDAKYVIEEAKLLRVDHYFEKIYGAQDNYKNFSKKMVIQKIINENRLEGSEVIAFGDGYVEIEEMKNAGGIAVGVATNEETRQGVDEWKRSRLIVAQADIIIPDFSLCLELENVLF